VFENSPLNYQKKPVFFTDSKIWILFQIGVLILVIIPSLGAILIGISGILFWTKHNKFILKQPLNLLLGILSLWLIFTSFFAPYQGEAFLGLANYLPFFFIFAPIHLLFSSLIQLRQIAWLVVIPSFLVAVLGLGQLFLGWHFPPILGWELVTGGIPQGRMSSVFIYANFLAIYFQIVLILGGGLWLEIYQHLKTQKWVFQSLDHLDFPFLFSPFLKNSKKKYSPIIKKTFKPSFSLLNTSQNKIFAFLTITLILDVMGLILTSSRNSWMISFFGAIAFLFYVGWYRIILALSTMIITIIWSAIGGDPVKTWLRGIIPRSIWGRLSDEIYPDRAVETLRITQWQFTWELIKKNPLMGWGLRNFTPLYENQWNIWLGHPHNLFLMFTAETGVIGIIFLSSFVGWIMVKNIILLKQLSRKNVASLFPEDRLILFTYLIAFGSCILFNCFDVSLFDLRVNIFTWLLLFALGGIIKVFDYENT
jgi:hypothetical protein